MVAVEDAEDAEDAEDVEVAGAAGAAAAADDAKDTEDPALLGPFVDVDVEAGVAASGPAPLGRSLTDGERADIERQLRDRSANHPG